MITNIAYETTKFFFEFLELQKTLFSCFQQAELNLFRIVNLPIFYKDIDLAEVTKTTWVLKDPNLLGSYVLGCR